MKKLFTLTLLCAFAFSSPLFAAEVSVDDCGAYAESNSRLDGKTSIDVQDVKDVSGIKASNQ